MMGVGTLRLRMLWCLAGRSDSDWKLFPIDPSEEVRPEPWLKAAMDTLNRELMRQGTRIRGQFIE